MTATTFSLPIRVVFYKSDGDWVAHCLEFDLIGTGRNHAEALKCLEEAVIIQVDASLKLGNPANLFSPADSSIMQKFAAGKNIVVGEVEITPIRIHTQEVEIEDSMYREYNGSETACAY